MVDQSPVIKHSIVIAAFNCEAWILSTVADVLNQTLKDFELIVVDDGSTDGTRKILEGVTDKRLRVVSQPNSGAPASPRNHGIRLARGEWVSFLDHDDRWSPNRLERVDREIETYSDSDVVTHRMQISTPDLKKQGYSPSFFDKKVSQNKSALYESLLTRGNVVYTSATTVRRSWLQKLGGFNEAKDVATAEDFDLWLRLASHGARFCFLNEFLGHYILQTGAMTRLRERHLRAIQTVLKQHSDLLETLQIESKPAKVRKKITGISEYLWARECHRTKDYKKAREHYWNSSRNGYTTAKVILGYLAAVCRIAV